MIEGGASEGACRVLQFWPQHLLFMGSIAILGDTHFYAYAMRKI